MASSAYYPSHVHREDDHHLSHRALRERSSNARNEVFPVPHDPLHKPSHLSYQTSRPPSHASNSHPLGRRGHHDGHRDLASSHDSHGVYLHLYKLRQRCDAYQKYRQNQDKHVHNRASDGVWPDDVEEIFWKAIAAHPPMGREKVKLSPHSADTKAYGRNELIAKYMENKLGKGFERLQFDSKKKQTKTPRKVVSSHIQVLKGKFKDSASLPDNKIVLYWLGKGEQKAKSARSRAAQLQGQRRPAHANSIFEPRYFGMYLARDTATDEDCVHEFAEPGRHLIPHADAWVTEDSLQRDLPLLYPLWCERRLNCTVVSAQTQINWRTEKPESEERQDANSQRKAPLPSLHLSIQNQFQLRSAAIPPGCYSIVRYYFGNTFYVANGPHKVTHPDERAPSLVELRMGSQFWVNTFQILWKRVSEAKKEAMQRGDSIDVEEIVKATDEQNRQTIASITAVVEIYKDCTEDHQGKVTLSQCPMMVVHWTFRTTPPDVPGRTLWRNIILPNQHQPQLEDDDDEDEMEFEGEAQDQDTSNAPVSGLYHSFEWPQTGMAAPMGPYDMEQAAAGTGVTFPWAAGEVTARNGMSGGASLLRADSGLDLDLGNTFNFDNVPLDPGMMGEFDVPGMDASVLASFDSIPPNNAHNAPDYSMTASSSFPAAVHANAPGPHSSGAHPTMDRSQEAATASTSMYSRHPENYMQHPGGYSAGRAHGHQVSSLRSTQQSASQQQAGHRGMHEGGSVPVGYQQGSQPEQVHTPTSLEDGASLTSQRQSEHLTHQHREHRPQPPFLSILPSQHGPARDSQPSTASTVSPHGHELASQGPSRESRYRGGERARTPQSAAGQTHYQFHPDMRHAPQYAQMSRPAYVASHSFYPQPAPESFDQSEAASEATTVAALGVGEHETPAAYADEFLPAHHHHLSMNQHYRLPNGDIQGFQILRSNDGSQMHGSSYDPKAHQRGLGLLFPPSATDGCGFMDHMGHMKQQHQKNDDPAEAGARQLLPSPIEAPLPHPH